MLLFLSRLCFRPPRKLQSFLAGLFGAPVGALATVQAWLQGVVTGRIGRFGWCALSQRSCLLLLMKSPQFRDFRVLAILATFVTVLYRVASCTLASASFMRWLPDQAIYFYWNSDGSEAPLVYGLVAGNRARWCSDQSSCRLTIAIPPVLG